MKRLFSIIALISVIAATGVVMTACGSDRKSSSEAFAGISEEDAKAMALLDLVTEEPSVESCKQGKDKNDADCRIVMMKDAEGDRYISYVNAAGSTTLPYTIL